MSLPPREDLDARGLIEALRELHGQPRQADWWDRYCALLAPLTRARAALALEREGETWRPLGAAGAEGAWLFQAWSERLEELAARALANGIAHEPLRDGDGQARLLAASRLAGLGEGLLLLDLPETERPRINELLLRAQLAADVSAPPARLPLPAPGVPALPQAGTLEDLLDLAAAVMREESHGAAALALVNGVAARSGAALAALAWRHGETARIAAISHLDRFERNTEAVGLLEAAVEEALDQGCDVVFPSPREDGLVTQAHERLHRGLGFTRIHSLALASGVGEPDAVLLVAEQEAVEMAAWQHPLHVSLGLLLPWLARMRDADRWWGARLADGAQRVLARRLGAERPWARLAAILAVAGLLFLVFGEMDYRVEATAQMGTDSTRALGAPFDGFVEQAHASAGDILKAGAPLATLDTRELAQQEAEALADARRYRAEADKSLAREELADVEIARRRLAQVEARLARLRLALDQARLTAPFDGVVVEGEKKDLQGAPVRKGERLYRIARVEGLYAVIHVPEGEIRHITPGARGELSLLARPEQSIPFQVESLNPIAQVRGQEGNHFALKARFTSPPQTWWRPGMSGLARVEAGRRGIFWVYTHKFLDRLRLWLWW